MKLRLSPRANSDLQSIANYLHVRSSQAAQQVQVQLTAALQLLTSHPQAGPKAGRGIRRFAVPRLPYLIFYRIDEPAEVVEVITIRHGARAPRLDEPLG